MANAQVLQNAANRFARVAGFSPIAVDGDVGPLTLSATQKALSYISIEQDGSIIPASVSDQAAAFANNAARSTSVLAANSVQVAAFLNYVADIVHLPAIYGPSVVPSTNAAVAAATGLTPMPGSGMSVSVFDAFKKLPTWQKAGLVALGLLGVVAVSHKLKERKQQLEGLYY